MLRDFFIPCCFDERLTQVQQHTTHAESGLVYETVQLSASELAKLIEKLRQPAYGFKTGSKAWQARAIKAWCKVAEEWKTLSFPEAKNFLASLTSITGLSEKMLQEALYNHFAVFNETILYKWLNRVKRERDQQPAQRIDYPELAFVVTAGNIPGVAVHPIIHLSLLGIPTLVKNASTEPLLLPAILETLARHDAEVASRIIALTWSRTHADLTETVMKYHPALVAFGDDDTIAKFSRQKKRLVDFGDRFSLTLVPPASAKTRLRQIAYDICMFEQMGCLSPQAIVLFTADWKQVDDFCQQLASAMTKMNETLPGNKRAPAQIQQWRGALAARAAAGEKIIVRTSAGTEWTVAAATHFDLDERVAYRFARVWPVASIEEVVEIFQRYQNKLHVLIWGGSSEELQKFRKACERVHPFDRVPIRFAGKAQSPNCGWLDNVNPAWRRLMRGLQEKE